MYIVLQIPNASLCENYPPKLPNDTTALRRSTLIMTLIMRKKRLGTLRAVA